MPDDTACASKLVVLPGSEGGINKYLLLSAEKLPLSEKDFLSKIKFSSFSFD